MFMATDTLEFPELHDESIPYMTFFRNCTKLLAAAGVHDFNMQVRAAVYLLDHARFWKVWAKAFVGFLLRVIQVFLSKKVWPD